jgi:hypothetical protein
LTAALAIPKGERGVLRLFALDKAAESGAVAQLLGVADLDPDQIDVIDLADLSGLGLAEYLTEGFAISPDQLDRARLDALTGHVLMIRSHAFRGRATTLTPSPQMTLIATFDETPTNWTSEPLQTASARRRLSPRAARSSARRIGAILFAVVMALVLLIVLLVIP